MTIADASAPGIAPAANRNAHAVLAALAPAGALLIVAAALQIYFGAFGDVSWLIHVCEAWLDGKTPYVDVIETNPPAAILIYMPAVALARALGVKPELTVAAFGFAVAAGSIASAVSILRRAGLLPRLAPIYWIVALFAFTILPGRTFDERDFFAVLFGLPFIALWTARASAVGPTRGEIALAGLGLGAMIAIKPPYALIPLAMAPFLVARVGAKRSLAAFEVYVAAALLAVYAVVSALEFPAYFHDVLPTVALAYLPVRETPMGLIANSVVVLWVAYCALLFPLTGRSTAKPMLAMPTLASLGALMAFFVQGKGWLYHAYPALALITLTAGAALQVRARDGMGLAIAASIAGATLASTLLFDVSPIPAAVGLALAAWVAAPPPPQWRRVERIVILGCGALFGGGAGLYAMSFPGPTEDFVRTLTSFAPHPRMAAIAEGLGAGFPLVRNVDGIWVQRTQGLLMTAGARRLIDERPADIELSARLAPIIARDRDMAAEDIGANRPDALLISRHGPRFHAWAMNDPVLSRARANYLLVARNANPDWPVDLYIRADLVGLRPTLLDDGR